MNTRINIKLAIFDDFLIPEDLSSYINLLPSSSWKKGDTIPIHKGMSEINQSVHLRKESLWEYSTGFVETLFFEEVSTKIEITLIDKISKLQEYIKRSKLSVSINIIVEIVDEQVPSLHFNLSFINMVNKLGAEIDIDTYIMATK